MAELGRPRGVGPVRGDAVIEIAVEPNDGPVCSLSWWGDDLVDWLGGHRWTLAGGHQRFGVGSTYRMDAAVGWRDVGVCFERLGTKGRIARWNGKLPSPGWMPLGIDELREIDRSYYHADDYAFPVALLALPDGREAIAHCPRRYDTLELELLDGTPLTQRNSKADDIFHSRLEVTPDGRWLLSSGWVWQPYNVACVYDVARALAEPGHLDGSGVPIDLDDFGDEADGATIVGDRLVIASLENHRLAVGPLDGGRGYHVPIDPGCQLPSRLMAWGADHVVGFDGPPRVIELATGRMVHRWDELDSGPAQWQPSVNMTIAGPPFLARDPVNRRFALAWPSADGASGRIVVVTSQAVTVGERDA